MTYRNPSTSTVTEPPSRGVNIGHRLYAVFFWTLLISNVLLMFPGALVVFVLTAPFDSKRRIQHLYSCFWAQLFFYLNPFWRLTIEGRRHLPTRSGAVLASNHESLGDILALFGLYRPFKWISKASVFKVPMVGWNMHFNRYIPLVRGNRESVRHAMAKCREWIQRGVPVLFFPEGTRTPDGQVGQFKDGAFQLAIDTGCPVVPIALTGLRDGLPKHGFVLRLWVRARISVLPPVDTTEFGDDVAALREHVRQLITRERLRLQTP